MNKNRTVQLTNIFKQQLFTAGSKCALFVVTGPSGSGKLTGLTAVLRELGVPFVMSTSADEQHWDDSPATSIQGLDRFLKQKCKFGIVSALRGAPSTANVTSSGQSSSAGVVIIRDLPFSVGHGESRRHFVQLISKYSKLMNVVLVVSDCVYRDGLGVALQTAVPELILVEFSPIAKTHLLKAVRDAAGSDDMKPKVAARKRRRKSDEADAMSGVYEACGGDLRFAKNICDFYGRSQTFSSKNGQSELMMPDHIAQLASKDDQIDLFHLLGKVLYAKRVDDGYRHAIPLPEHLLMLHQREPAKDYPTDLVAKVRDLDVFLRDQDAASVTTSKFLMQLYGNLPKFIQHQLDDDIECFSECLQSISEADLMMPFGHDDLDYARHVAVIGVFHARRPPAVNKRQLFTFNKIDYLSLLNRNRLMLEAEKCDFAKWMHSFKSWHDYLTDFYPHKKILESAKRRPDFQYDLVDVDNANVDDADDWWMWDDDIC